MKKFLMLLSILCCGAYADTINLHWLNEDGTTYQNSTCTVDGDLELPTPPTKYGYTFTGWELLPYTPLEYIQSGGTQYINTGIQANSNNIVEFKISDFIKGYYNESIQIYGCTKYGLTSQNYNKMYVYNVSGGHNFTNCSNCMNSSDQIIIKHSCSTGLIIDNVQYDSEAVCQSFSDVVRIFAADNKCVNNNKCGPYKLYYFKITDKDNNLLINLVPAIDNNDVVCLYDTVSKQFFYNQGTGQFIAGPILQ